MNHDYKSALDAIGCMRLIENRSVKHLKGTLYYKHYETIRAALQLAQEAEQRKSFKANIDDALAQEIMRTETVDGAICAFTIPRDELVESLKAENAELKNSIEILSQKLRDYSKAIDRLDAKLEKAKDIIIDMEKSDDAQAFKEARKFIDTHCSRTTLEELTKK